MTEIKKSPFYILFVDDEEKARKYFVKGLEKDFNILTAQSVDEAQKIIDEKYQEIAVVISDQRMPGGNGVKILQYLRENYPSIIRLLTTAYSDLTDAIDCVNKGEILRYIQKPWDYDMLKHELLQALALFEIKLERDELLYEKLMVKKRMTKIDRVRQLVLLAKTLGFIRFSDLAIASFVRKFATIKDQSQQENWQDFELGNGDLLETLFLLEIVEKVNQQIPFNQNYQFETKINSQQIAAIITQTSQDKNIAVSEKSIQEIGEIVINDFSFKNAIKSLIHYVGENNLITKLIIENVDEDQFLIKFQTDISGSENDNIFFISPVKKTPINSSVDLLVSYFLIGHHGGNIKISTDQNQIRYSIYLPKNPLNFSKVEKLAVEDLDDMLLCVLMSDS